MKLLWTMRAEAAPLPLDRDQNRRDESAYYNNKYYQQGWKDGGLKHKHKSKKWKNDADRQAYEAGYMHGDRGEPWQKQKSSSRSGQ